MEKSNNNQIKIKLKTLILFICLILIIIIGIIFAIHGNSKNDKNEINTIQNGDKQIAKESNTSNTDFSFKFLKIENKKENMIYSPLSIKYALYMLNEGANGNTKAQIEKVIEKTNLKKYDNINNILALANAVYIRDTDSKYIKDEYKNKLLNNYNAEIKYDAFKNAKNINSWIENKTFGQIKNMLKDENVVNPKNVMFLINALAIDMEWKEEFDKEDTYGGKFYLENGKEMIATMMNKETKSDNVSYYKDKNITAISMELKQYGNEQMEFLAIMPNEGLQDYINNFSTNTLENIDKKLSLASKTKNGLDIHIPKFSFDYDLELKEDLKTLGITDAFDSELANFSNMTSKNSFIVGDALHKANIDFSEEGIKAAAVTVIGMAEMMAVENVKKPIEIIIDKPFMYVIRDKENGEIWFVGTVYEPNSWEDEKTDYLYR